MARTKAHYAVLELTDSMSVTVVVCDLDDSEAARKWIKESGASGVRYQVAAFIGGAMQVEVKQVEKRHLVAE